MLPKLYDSFATETAAGPVDFIGTLTHCTKCLVTENTDSEYTLELETTVNDPPAASLISQRILGVKPNPTDPVQYFELQGTSRSLNGRIQATAKHVKNYFNQLTSEGDISATDTTISFTLTPLQIYDKLFSDGYISDITGFSFTSDILTALPFSVGFNNPVSMGNILGGVEGSMLDVFGGEFKYDNYDIRFLRARGKEQNYALRYGENISSANQSEDISVCYSHIRPWGTVSRTDGKSIILFADEYEIPNNECRTKKVLPLDCSDAVQKMQVGTQGQGYADAQAALTAYAQIYASANGIGKVRVGIQVTSRAELDGMLGIGLCDTVKVILDNYGITTKAKITSVTYNALLERWEKMTVGKIPATLADIILDKRRFNI